MLKGSEKIHFEVPVPLELAMCKCLFERNLYNVAVVQSVNTAWVPGLLPEGR